MDESLVGILALAAVTVAALHSLAPDHWVPFAALARARGWSPWRTARITALCGFGHVTVSVLLGLLALVFGVEVLELFGRRMEAVAGLLLIGFGLTYGLVGLRRALRLRLSRADDHGHTHHRRRHHDRHDVAHSHAHPHGDDAITPRALLLLFSADPCVPVIPILFAAAPLGISRTAAVIAAYEIATIATMVALVLPATAAVSRIDLRWLNRYGDATAGAVIAFVGVFVAALGW